MTIYIIGIAVVSIIVNYFLIKRNIVNDRIVNALKKNGSLTVKAEEKKNEVRSKYEKISSSGDSVILPVVPKHNHTFSSKCTPDCPKYNK